MDALRLLVTIAIAIVGDVVLIIIKGTRSRPRTWLIEFIFIVSFPLLSLAENKAADPLCATFTFVFFEGHSGIDAEFADDGLAVSSPYPTQTFVDNLVGC